MEDKIPTVVADLECSGNESELLSCRFGDSSRASDCSQTEDAGVVCQSNYPGIIISKGSTMQM